MNNSKNLNVLFIGIIAILIGVITLMKMPKSEMNRETSSVSESSKIAVDATNIKNELNSVSIALYEINNDELIVSAAYNLFSDFQYVPMIKEIELKIGLALAVLIKHNFNFNKNYKITFHVVDVKKDQQPKTVIKCTYNVGEDTYSINWRN